MGTVFEQIDESLASWLQAQPVFFVATAATSVDQSVNCSPKGTSGTFTVIDGHTVAYLDLTGSGVETIAHLRDNGRIVIMFCAFDGPPRIAALARSALLAADLVLIPVQPSPYDVWASAEMVALIREAQVFRPTLRAAFVINRRVGATVIGREARGALADQPMPPLLSEVRQRIIFADSVASGQLARELDEDSLAAREIASLADEVARMAP